MAPCAPFTSQPFSHVTLAPFWGPMALLPQLLSSFQVVFHSCTSYFSFSSLQPSLDCFVVTWQASQHTLLTQQSLFHLNNPLSTYCSNPQGHNPFLFVVASCLTFGHDSLAMVNSLNPQPIFSKPPLVYELLCRPTTSPQGLRPSCDRLHPSLLTYNYATGLRPTSPTTTSYVTTILSFPYCVAQVHLSQLRLDQPALKLELIPLKSRTLNLLPNLSNTMVYLQLFQGHVKGFDT